MNPRLRFPGRTTACLLLGSALAAPGAERERAPRIEALLINGGASSAKNYLSHLHHLEDMVRALRARGVAPEHIHVFSADGEDGKPDLSSRTGEPPGFFLLEETAPGRALFENAITNTVWEGQTLHPARLVELRRFFAGMRKELRPKDTLFVFVTDHGTKDAEDPENAYINLWNESLSVLELRALLDSLKPGVRILSVMSQCYAGAFADAMTRLADDLPDGASCGFYATARDRPAYGCYPEGRDRDRVGHAFRFIDAMGRYASSDAVHASVLVSDTTPDVPLRTSDLFAQGLVEAEAKRRKVENAAQTDELLRRAFVDRARHEHEIRLLDRIGEVYGTFSPRTLAELGSRIESLSELSAELETYEGRWKLTLNDLRRENLAQFLEQSPAWKERLEDRKLAALSSAERTTTLSELLPTLQAFTSSRPEVSRRLDALRATQEDAERAQYRVDVRLAALLRMKTLLVRIAGEELLAEDAPESAAGDVAAERRALGALEACERGTLGDFAGPEGPFPPDAPDPLPPFEEDLAAVKRALPSWLGIRFRPVPDAQRERLGVERGAVVVEQVYEDSPAALAGVRRGDVLLGPEAAHFAEPNQIREWIMTSPRDAPRGLELLRDGATRPVQVSLVAMPAKLPSLPAPPKVGDAAPVLASLRMVRPEAGEATALAHERHLLFFWATWCGPCKSSLPELTSWSKQSAVPVVAVSDEDPDTIRKFLDAFEGPFPELVASDALRLTIAAYGVSGTPTFVLVDAQGKIEARQVGYSRDKGLALR